MVQILKLVEFVEFLLIWQLSDEKIAKNVIFVAVHKI